MLGTLLKAALGALFGALNDYISGKRRDEALRSEGRLETLQERMDVHIATEKAVAHIRHKLTTDHEYRQWVRDKFTAGDPID